MQSSSELALKGRYYAECHKVFRAATNQAAHMLAALAEECAGMQELEILSVGSGSGLFELPMLQRLAEAGQRVRRFSGVDVDADACRLFEAALQHNFGDTLDYAVHPISFEDYASESPVDLVLYNHVFEYVRAGQREWLRKSLGLLKPGGKLLLFSPLSGGINRPYAENMQSYFGYRPYYSEDITALLDGERLAYRRRRIEAQCQIGLLEDLGAEGDGMRLLSFLAQVDCRRLPAEEAAEQAAYFQSLRRAGQAHIPHPTDLFVLQNLR